jgi:hypothetical protein
MNNINNKWWLENVLWIYSKIDEFPTINFMQCRCKTEGILFSAFQHIQMSTIMQSLYHCPSSPCKITTLELYVESLQYGSKCCKMWGLGHMELLGKFYLYVVSSLFKYTCNQILLYKKSSLKFHFETNNEWN